jgi:CubicO group peptidase (beta-lactamase class C family)
MDRALEGLDPAALQRLHAGVQAAIAQGQLPGAVVRLERLDKNLEPGLQHEAAFGLKALEPAPEPLDATTVYDCASLTKVVVTAPVLARLMDGGAVAPQTRVRQLLPAFAGGEAITVGQLLTHTSGLPAGLPLEEDWRGPDAALALCCARQPTHAPGTFFRYSDVNFILLGALAERLAGRPLEALAQEWLLGPLGMADSGFRQEGSAGAAPSGAQGLPLERIAPTEWQDEHGLDPADRRAAGRGATPQMLRGVVHDPTARRMGGVAGHAGLFSTAADLARYARMVLGGGQLDGVRVLSEAAVRRMTAVATPPGMAERRSLGWDVDTPFSRARGAVYRVGSVGHTGFTGCALWIDPSMRAFHVLLSNRVHPRSRESIVALYESVATAAAQAVSP